MDVIAYLCEKLRKVNGHIDKDFSWIYFKIVALEAENSYTINKFSILILIAGIYSCFVAIVTAIILY